MFLAPENSEILTGADDLEGLEFLRTLGNRLLREIGIGSELHDAIEKSAIRNGTDFQTELGNAPLFDEYAYYRGLANLLDLPFLREIDPTRIIIKERDIPSVLNGRFGPNILLYREREGASSVLVAPRHNGLYDFALHLCRYPDLRARIRIVLPSEMRRALAQCGSETFLDKAINYLAAFKPHFSARMIASAWQGAFFGALAVALPLFHFLHPLQTALITHSLFSVFFLACVYLRCSAAASRPTGKYWDIAEPKWNLAPKYTVLVPLHRESDIVADLLVALSRIEWPRSKLEVKLVCEADDLQTIQAISNQNPPKWVETIAVPPSLPRTKPKALNYALQLSTGAIVCVFDAEDRPHPRQLLEAWQRFEEAGPELACLQAPLIVANFRQNALARLFSFEYAALFRGILPWLARHGRIFPLGGTSNHFRRKALEEIGGWDPYNVTEDADIGIRLLRHGYRMSTITRPTVEDAPDNFTDWLKQRTRWYKGWIQTWLVHNRSPAALWREIGPASFIFGQILFSGMIVSALVHPAFIFVMSALLAQYISGASFGWLKIALAIIDSSNIVLAYAAFLLLGYRTLIDSERVGFWGLAGRMPFYWLAVSLAAWRAVYQLVRNPFLWEKTPHKRHYRPNDRLQAAGIKFPCSCRFQRLSSKILSSRTPIAPKSRPS